MTRLLLGIIAIIALLCYLRHNSVEDFKANKDNMDKESSTNPQIESGLVFIDVQLAGSDVGRIVIQLFDSITPKTCENFRQLCISGKYKGVPFHRIIKGFMLQGGDITNGDGTGGYSIYGDKFEDENFQLRHDQPGLLSMANSGSNTNGSQFFIIVAPQPHLDGKHVVFGRVVQGYELVERMENIPTKDEQPIYPCEIINCGRI